MPSTLTANSIFDSDGKIIHEVMPGAEKILGKINPAQYEHCNRTWRITDIQVRSRKRPQQNTDWFATVGDRANLPDFQILISIENSDGSSGKFVLAKF